MDVSGRFLAFTLHGAGWVLWMLIALSVMSMAVMLERLWYFRAHRVCRRKLAAEIRTLLRECDARGEAGAPGLIEMAAPSEMTAAIEGVKTRERLRLERRLPFLATLGSNGPFVGLFGTVLGIIKAFHDLGGHARDGRRGRLDRDGGDLGGAGGHGDRPLGRHPRRRRLQLLQPPGPRADGGGRLDGAPGGGGCPGRVGAHRRTAVAAERLMAAGGPDRDDGCGGMFAAINVTPMVDVTLVLLVIFMVAAPLHRRQPIDQGGAAQGDERRRDQAVHVGPHARAGVRRWLQALPRRQADR